MNNDYQLKVGVRKSIDHITKNMCEGKGGDYNSKSLDLATDIFIHEIDLSHSKKIIGQWVGTNVLVCLVNFIIHTANVVSLFFIDNNILLTVSMCIVSYASIRYCGKGLKSSFEYHRHVLKKLNLLLTKARDFRDNNKQRDNYLIAIGVILDDINKEYKPALEYLESFQRKERENV